MGAAPVLDYLAKDGFASIGAIEPVSLLKVFARSIGQKFIKGHVFGGRLCPEGLND
jgi:hypothetical protein